MSKHLLSLGFCLMSVACLTPAQGGGANAPATGGAAQSGTSAGPPPGAKVVWDGDTASAGKGWASCGKEGACKTTIEPAPNLGHSGAGLKFHAEGPEWIGFGWNWHGWWPAEGGTDISAYKTLTFRVKIAAADAKEAPDPNSITVAIRCSAGGSKDESKTNSNTAKLTDYAQTVGDGQWHDVKIPLDVFYKEKGAGFDKKTAWELDMGTWSQEPRKFDILVDDITFQ